MTTIGYITTTITWFGFFAAFFFAYYYFLQFRNRERMLLIEKNIDISEIYKKKKSKFPWYILGFTLLGVSIGTIASILIFMFSLNIQDEAAVTLLTLASILFTGAIGIIVGNIIEKKRA
ncbi:MAG: hypothetical protein IMY72_02055 [Bacteroidetes bacterium]|nr:hypothetical protein [Bacteroidota bacterium]